MRFRRLKFLPALLPLLAACDGDQHRQAPNGPADSVRFTDTAPKAAAEPELHLLPDTGENRKPATADYIAFVERKMPEWVRYLRRLDPQFSIRDFSAGQAGTLHSLRHGKYSPPAAKEDSVMATLYSWSPDRKFFVDIYSQRYLLTEENGRYYLEGGDPESGILLTDLRDSTWYLVAYTGSIQSYDDVAWMDEHRFIVTGTIFDHVQDSLFPYFEVYDVATNEMQAFSGQSVPVNKNGESYPCVKFPAYCRKH